MNDDFKFDFYRGLIQSKETEIELTRKAMLQSERVSDYWGYLNKLNKLTQEKWILEHLAKEKGIYIV